MKRITVMLLWLVLVFLLTRFVPNWQAKTAYAELLPASAKQVLAQQPPLQIDVFALPGTPAASLVDNFLAPLLDGLPEAAVNYIDASQNPEVVQTHQISKQGEMIIRHQDRDFQLSTLSYEAFFNGLKSLNQTADKWVVFFDSLGGKSFNPGVAGSLIE